MASERKMSDLTNGDCFFMRPSQFFQSWLLSASSQSRHDMEEEAKQYVHGDFSKSYAYMKFLGHRPARVIERKRNADKFTVAENILAAGLSDFDAESVAFQATNID